MFFELFLFYLNGLMEDFIYMQPHGTMATRIQRSNQSTEKLTKEIIKVEAKMGKLCV